jgi:hypothetical protein
MIKTALWRWLLGVVWILPLSSWRETADAADSDAPAVPFMTCPEEGQKGPTKLQGGQLLPNALDPSVAAQIVYYGAAHTPGVFAPKGWHCLAWTGSSGSILLVTPQRIAPPYYPLPVITGPAVMIQFSEGTSSGRFHVAITASRLFSVVGSEFIAGVRQEHLISDASFDAKPYPDDQLRYLSDRLVEYTTPANRAGLGTESMLEMSNMPVKGLSILNLETEATSLTEVRIRLPAGLNSVAEAIVQLETVCLQLQRGCRRADAPE